MPPWVHTKAVALREKRTKSSRLQPETRECSTLPTDKNLQTISATTCPSPNELDTATTMDSTDPTSNPTLNASSENGSRTASALSLSPSKINQLSMIPNKENYPKRPLSALNLFFRLERERVLAGRPLRPYTRIEVDHAADSARFESQKKHRSHKKANHPNPVGFLELTRLVNENWNALEACQKEIFQDRAAVEKDAYLERLRAWKAMQPPKPPKKRRRTKAPSRKMPVVYDDDADMPSNGLWHGFGQETVLQGRFDSSEHLVNSSTLATPCTDDADDSPDAHRQQRPSIVNTLDASFVYPVKGATRFIASQGDTGCRHQLGQAGAGTEEIAGELLHLCDCLLSGENTGPVDMNGIGVCLQKSPSSISHVADPPQRFNPLCPEPV